MALNDEVVEHIQNELNDWKEAYKRLEQRNNDLQQKYNRAMLDLARIKKVIWNIPELEQLEFWK